MAGKMAPEADAAQREGKPEFTAPKKKKKWPRRVILIAILGAAAALALMAYRRGSEHTVSSEYIPAQATMQEMAVTVTGTGAVKPNDSAQVTALARSEILEAAFAEGDLVERGQVLYRLDPTDGENALRNAQSGVDRAQLAVEQAQLSYDSLRKTQRDNRTDMVLKANATGTVAKLYVKEGDTVAAGTPVADILDRDTMELTIPFHSVDAARFFVGQGAQITTAGSAQTLSGTIKEIGTVDSVIAGGARVRQVVIRAANPGALTSGATATALVDGVAAAAVGTFDHAEAKQLLAPMSGTLETLSVQEGDKVQDRQVLGEFETPDLQEQLDGALLSLRSAQLGLSDAQEALRLAQEGVEDYLVTAPISGTVVERKAEAGDDLATFTGPLAVIFDLSRLTFDMNISELDIAQLQVGQSVSFTSDALEGKRFSGRVEKIDLNGITQNGSTSYPVTVAITQGDGLYPGMNVSATVLVEDIGRVLTVPVDAIQRGNLVYVAGEGALDKNGNLVKPDKLVEREVQLGRSDSENIQILGGLSEGETVYIPNATTNLMDMMMTGGGAMLR